MSLCTLYLPKLNARLSTIHGVSLFNITVGQKPENERRKTTDKRVSVIFEPGVDISEGDQVKGRFRSGRRGRRLHVITTDRADFLRLG